MIPQIVITIEDVKPNELKRINDELYRQWRSDFDATLPEYPIVNEPFIHDPEWKSNIMSIQAAHDWDRSWFWTFIAGLYVLASMGFGFIQWR